MELDKRDCYNLKGMAITSIIIHNFCHWLPNAPQENEFCWKADNVNSFWSSFDNIDPFIAIFSFLGHYGVPIFVFITGYGLVKKYIELDGYDNIKKYVIQHYLKLTRLLLVGLVLYYIVSLLLDKDELNVITVPLQLIYFCNIVPTKYLTIVPGPYWYFGLTMQFYILFLFVRKDMMRRCLLFLLCSITLLLVSSNHHNMTVWLKYNCFGSSIPLVLGFFYARYNSYVTINSRFSLIMVFVLSTILLLGLEQTYVTWMFSSIPVLLGGYSLMVLSRPISSFFEEIGKVSNYIFVIHPICRLLIFSLYDSYHLSWYICLLIYVIISVLLAMILSRVIIKITMIVN